MRDYLRYGVFEDERETDKTWDTAKTTRFDVKLGRDKSLELLVKTAEEVGGQFGPAKSASFVIDRRPHGLLVVTDLSRPREELIHWITEFCQHLEDGWRIKSGRGNRIQSVIFILNKRDKVTSEIEIDREHEIRQVLNRELHQARGKISGQLPIMQCVLVTNPQKTSLVDMIVSRLARALAQ